jgi:hypothetical protein
LLSITTTGAAAVRLTDLEHGDAGAIGQMEIEDHDVGAEQGNPLECLGDARGLARHGHARHVPHHLGRAVADDRGVVNNDHLHVPMMHGPHANRYRREADARVGICPTRTTLALCVCEVTRARVSA